MGRGFGLFRSPSLDGGRSISGASDAFRSRKKHLGGQDTLGGPALPWGRILSVLGIFLIRIRHSPNDETRRGRHSAITTWGFT